MKTYNIVIVENDEDERFFMSEEMRTSGKFEIIGQYSNGDTLLEWLEGHPQSLPDMILSDLNMPGKNGYDILRAVNSNAAFSNIPVIITSTSPMNSIREKCLAMGATDYLVKPDIFIDYSGYVNDLYQRLEKLPTR
jgi:CheY-like chemotaxis protein